MTRARYWTGHLDLTRVGLLTYRAVVRGDGWETPRFFAVGRRRTVRKVMRHARCHGIELRDASSPIAYEREQVGEGQIVKPLRVAA
jgi:hypothetical protein